MEIATCSNQKKFPLVFQGHLKAILSIKPNQYCASVQKDIRKRIAHKKRKKKL
jgi:hypothetical protein